MAGGRPGGGEGSKSRADPLSTVHAEKKSKKLRTKLSWFS